MNFISKKSLNKGTFSRFKSFLAPYKTSDMKIQNFPSQNRQNNRLSQMMRRLSLLQFARKNSSCLACRNEFRFNLKLKRRPGTLPRFKRSVTPCRTRDMKIQNFHREIRDKNQFLFSNFTSQNRDNNKCCVACRVENNIIQVRSQKLFMSGLSK